MLFAFLLACYTYKLVIASFEYNLILNHDKHVLSEPSLIARNARSNAQREAFLAEQRIATITAAERPDLALGRKMRNDNLYIARHTL